MEAFKVSQQAASERLRAFLPELFYRVLMGILPQMQARWQARQRPAPLALAWARERFPQALILDGSTLDALLKKVGLLRDSGATPLAGRMAALQNLGTRLPQQLWYEDDSQAHDQRFWERVLAEWHPNPSLGHLAVVRGLGRLDRSSRRGTVVDNQD